MTSYPRFDVTGQVALVTGAARGLGRAVALALSHAGADVALGLRDVTRDGGVVAEIEAMGRRAMAVACEVSDIAQVRAAVGAVVERFGRLDILVNNAGASPENPAEGTFFASQEAGRVMIRQGGGRIVMMGSQAGSVALPGESVYCMTKAAIAHLTRCLAVEWGEHGVTVNCVAPTFIRTPGTEPALADPAFEAEVVERIAALHRIGEPMDVAGAVLFLCSPAASMVTGHTLLVDGGWTAR